MQVNQSEYLLTRGSPMSEINLNLIYRVGVDLAKRVYKVHAVGGFE